jgi:ribonuclease VapC
MFVDASALIAMLTDEDEARILAARLQAAPKRMTAPPQVLEAVAAVAALWSLPLEETDVLMKRFLERMGIQLVSLPPQVVPLAAAALARYGRTAGHPAAFETGDALAYAAARYYRLPLLYKGGRFAATDIEPA